VGRAWRLARQFNGPNSITTDQDGNVYLAEVFDGRLQKFRRSAAPIRRSSSARSYVTRVR